MSNPESFIEEVTEEVRRDQLFAAMRKWGWIGVLAVVLIVGGAAANEWMKARDAQAAQETGDAVLSAMSLDDADARRAALQAIAAEGETAAVIAMIEATDAQTPERADTVLSEIAGNGDLPTLYRDLATLKRVMLPGGPMTAADKMAALEPLLSGGAFRTLAEEQMALAELEAGDKDATRTRLEALIVDAEASGDLRDRASQLIVALGGDVD